MHTTQRNSVKELADFVDKYPEAECSGFFWCDSDESYHVVILASRQGTPSKGKKTAATEFLASTPTGLCRMVRKAGFIVGSPKKVKELCESAPRSIRRIQR